MLGINEKLLIEVMQTGEARTLTHGGGAKLPTEHVLVLSALHKEKKCVGVVELFQRPDVPIKRNWDTCSFWSRCVVTPLAFLKAGRWSLESNADLKNQFWTDFEQFSLRFSDHSRNRKLPMLRPAIASRRRGCDRVSVAIRKGRSFRIRAVSGQSSVNGRANLIVAILASCPGA